MNKNTAPQTLLASIPGWRARPASLTPIHGGLHHDCYRIESAGYRYVLRIAREDGVAGGGSRELESYLQQQAASRGLAAPVLYSDARRGVILMEELPGEVLTAEHVRAPGTLQQIGELLRQLHALPLCGVNFDPSSAADDYLSAIDDGALQSAIAQRCVEIISETPRPKERSCCHNDLIASNLIRGETLRLIDFEYACDNEPMFDLASLLCWHNLGANERGTLLQAYAGDNAAELAPRLDAQCRLFDALQWLWLAARQQEQPETRAEAQMTVVQNRLG